MEDLLSAPNYTVLYMLLGAAIFIIFLLISIIWKGKHTNGSEAKASREESPLEALSQTINLAIEAGSMSIGIYNSKDDTIVNIHGNPLTSEGKIQISDYMNYVHHDEAKLLADALESIFKCEKQHVYVQCRIKVVTGEYRWQSLLFMPKYAKDGSVEQIIGVRQDINEWMTIPTKTENNERNLLNTLEDSPIPVYIVNTKNNHISYSNRAATELLHHDISRDLSKILDADALEYHANINKQIIKTGVAHFAREVVELLNGDILQTYVSKVLTEYEGEKQILVTRFDLTKRVELDHITKLLNLSLSAVKAFAWEMDSRFDTINFSRGLDVINNIHTVEEFMVHVHPDDVKMFEELMSQPKVEGHQLFTVQYRADFTSKNKEYEWWETRSNYTINKKYGVEYILTYGVSININEQKKAEQELIENHNRLEVVNNQKKIILENSLSALIYFDSDFTVQWTNIERFDNICNNRPWYKIGCKCHELKGEKEPCGECPIAQSKMLGKPYHYKITDKNTDKVYNCIATPIYELDTYKGCVVRFDDMTEHESLICDLQEAIAHARESDRLKSAFLANMSHEIRTPLNAIMGFSNLLIEEDDNETKYEYSKIIKHSGDLLINLINDILDLSKIDAGVFELKESEVDFVDLFNENVASHTIRNENPNVEIIAKNPYKKLLAVLDVQRVSELMNNYISNAVKYTPKGSITIGYEMNGENLYFYVQDTGLGIAKEKQNKLFKRFEKLDSYAQGTGLGLAIVEALVSKMGGNCGFESEEGKGSLFFVNIPIKVICLEKIESLDNSSKLDILIAEDIESNYLLLKYVLKRHNLTWVNNGEKGVEEAKKHKFDIILMDRNMPIMNGLEAVLEIRKFDKETPIIAVTANVFEHNKKEALDAGCSAFISKPIDPEILMQTINDLVPNDKRERVK